MWYQRLFGDTRTSALSVTLERDPSPLPGAAPRLVQSWGSVAVYVGERCLTQNRRGGRMGAAVTWYLLPLLQWLDANAVRLLNEEPLPLGPVDGEVGDAIDWLDSTVHGPPVTATEAEEDRWFDTRSRWQERRCLRAGLPGALAPFLPFGRVGDQVELSW